MASEASTYDDGTTSVGSVSPRMSVAQEMQMEEEMRRLKAKQRDMETEMQQMRRDLQEMRNRVHQCPTMVEQQAGLMLKANSTDVKREIAQTREELSARTDELFTKDEYETRLRSKASVDMVVSLCDKMLREIASATGCEEELGVFFRDQRLNIVDSKSKTLEEHFMHMQEESDQQHVKLQNDLRRVNKIISESKKEAQADHKSTKNSIRGLEKRVNSLEDSRHHSQAIRHIVAAGLEETDPEVREARKHVHEAIHVHDDASSVYSGIHSHHSFDEESDKNATHHRNLDAKKHGKRHHGGIKSQARHKHGRKIIDVSENKQHTTESQSTDRKTPTASHTTPVFNQTEKDISAARLKYEQAVNRVEKMQKIDQSKLTIRDKASLVIKKQILRRHAHLSSIVFLTKMSGKALANKKSAIKAAAQEEVLEAHQQLDDVEASEEEEDDKEDDKEDQDDQDGFRKEGDGSEEEQDNISVKSWASEGASQESGSGFYAGENTTPAQRLQSDEQSIVSAAKESIRSRDELESSFDKEEQHDMEVLMATLGELRNRIDRVEQNESKNYQEETNSSSEEKEHEPPNKYGRMTNLRISTLEKTVHALAQEQATVSAVGKHTATNLGEVDKRLDAMATQVIQVLESEAKRLAWDEAQMKALKKRCDDVDGSFNKLKTEIARKLNQLRVDIKEKIRSISRKVGKGLASGGGAEIDDLGEELDINGKLAQMERDIRGLREPLEEQAIALKFETEGVVSELQRHRQLYRDMLAEYMLVVQDLYSIKNLSKAEVTRLREEHISSIRSLQEQLMNGNMLDTSRSYNFHTTRPEVSLPTVDSSSLQDMLPALREALTRADHELHMAGMHLPVDSGESKRESGRSLAEQLSRKHSELTRKAYRAYTPGGFSMMEEQLGSSSIAEDSLSTMGNGTTALWEPSRPLKPGETLREGGGTPSNKNNNARSIRSADTTMMSKSLDFDFEYIHQPITPQIPKGR